MDVLKDALMDGWMDGWMAGWIDGWMDGWLDGAELRAPSIKGSGVTAKVRGKQPRSPFRGKKGEVVDAP